MEILIAVVVILVIWNFILTISAVRISEKTDDAYSAAKDGPRKYEFDRLERELNYLEDDHSRDINRARQAIAKICEHLGIHMYLKSQPEEVMEIREIEEDQEDS